MKRLIFAVAAVVFATSQLLAQSPRGLEMLPNGAKVTLDSASQVAINSANFRGRGDDRILGYTICVYADNGQNARSTANATLAKLKAQFPGFYTELKYENPFFKVYISRCLNRSEAARMLGMVKPSFPRSIIAMEEFPISIFSEIPAEVPDSIIVPTIEELPVVE